MEKVSKEFQVFIKPVGAECNLHCHYCYYIDKQSSGNYKPPMVMPDHLLERCTEQIIAASEGPVVLFSWHGGEPILAGTGFYKKAVALQKKHNREGKTILNGIQTNGTLLNEEWCRFLAQKRFMVGISIDGTKPLHDDFRRNKNGHGSFERAIGGYHLLQKHGIVNEILCVVNSGNVGHPLEIYRFFKSLDARFITFLPLVERDGNTASGVSPASVPAEAFGDFMIAIFNEWLENDIGNIQVQLIEEAIRTAFDQEHVLCVLKQSCGGVPVLEMDGSLYSCDHFVNSKHLLGNIGSNKLADMLLSEKQTTFGHAKQNLPGVCLACPVLKFCNGECPKNRFVETGEGQPGLNYLCTGYKKFFLHIQPFVEAVRLSRP